MEEWDYNENQGKRRDQLMTTYKTIYFLTVLALSLIIADLIYLSIK